MDLVSEHGNSAAIRRILWIGLIAATGLVLSSSFACVTPFAALACLAGLKLDRRDAALVLGIVWIGNQITGFGWLNYPLTADTVGWGLAIGLSTYLAMFAARALATSRPAPLALSLPFIAAFAAFEFGLYAAGVVLPGSEAAFSALIVRQVFIVNAAAFCGLMAAYHLAMLTAHAMRHGTPASVGG